MSETPLHTNVTSADVDDGKAQDNLKLDLAFISIQRILHNFLSPPEGRLSMLEFGCLYWTQMLIHPPIELASSYVPFVTSGAKDPSVYFS